MSAVEVDEDAEGLQRRGNPRGESLTAADARYGSSFFFGARFAFKTADSVVQGRDGSDFRSCPAQNVLVTPLAVGHNVQQSAPKCPDVILKKLSRSGSSWPPIA